MIRSPASCGAFFVDEVGEKRDIKLQSRGINLEIVKDFWAESQVSRTVSLAQGPADRNAVRLSIAG